MRLANAIFHTYKIDEYKELEREVPLKRVCELFRLSCDENSMRYISSLIHEILDEPIAVIDKELNHRYIKWETYNFFTLLSPIEMGAEVIKLRINPDYLTIIQTFVVNPYLEF